MIRRTCVCGARIIVADLDGWTVWLDTHPAEHGMFSVVAGEDIPWIAVDPTGPYQRHTCHADRRPITVTPSPAIRLAAVNARRTTTAAELETTAARAVLAARRPLTTIEQHAALLRLANPDLNAQQIANKGGIKRESYLSAIKRVRRYANQLAHAGAAA